MIKSYNSENEQKNKVSQHTLMDWHLSNILWYDKNTNKHCQQPSAMASGASSFLSSLFTEVFKEVLCLTPAFLSFFCFGPLVMTSLCFFDCKWFSYAFDVLKVLLQGLQKHVSWLVGFSCSCEMEEYKRLDDIWAVKIPKYPSQF